MRLIQTNRKKRKKIKIDISIFNNRDFEMLNNIHLSNSWNSKGWYWCFYLERNERFWLAFYNYLLYREFAWSKYISKTENLIKLPFLMYCSNKNLTILCPLHMDEQRQPEPTYSSSVPIRDVALMTCRKQWTIRRCSERGLEISVLIAQHDDDDIYIYIYIYIKNGQWPNE